MVVWDKLIPGGDLEIGDARSRKTPSEGRVGDAGEVALFFSV